MGVLIRKNKKNTISDNKFFMPNSAGKTGFSFFCWKLMTNTLQINHDLRQRLKALRLPMMSQILLKLMEMCQSEETGVNELAQLVASDPAMTARMMGVANSSAYCRNDPARNLEQAMSVIGTDMIKTIVISESVFQVFDQLSRGNELDLNRFWFHSLLAAINARMLAIRMHYCNPEEAYLAGLLHDIGRIVFLALEPKEYSHYFHDKDSDDLCVIETKTFQASHAEVGAWLIDEWKLNSFIADSVLCHHEPVAKLKQSHSLIRIIYLAHLIADEECAVDQMNIAAVISGLTASDLREVKELAAEQVRQVAQHLGIKPEPLSQRQTNNVENDTTKAESDSSVKTQDNLSTQVRNMALGGQIGKTFSLQQSEVGLLDTITQSACILFKLDHATILHYDQSENSLRGSRAGAHLHRLADFILPIGGNDHQIAMSIREAKMVLIGDSKKNLGGPEEQLLRLFETERLACLPLLISGQCLGVLIGGMAAWQKEDFEKNGVFLKEFSQLAATALKNVLRRQDELDAVEIRLNNTFRDASRKVAHEVNNPLSVIKNYLSILERKLIAGNQSGRQSGNDFTLGVTSDLTILHEEIDRVGKIVDDFAELDLTQKKGSSEIGQVVRDVQNFFQQAEFFVETVKIESRMLGGKAEVNASADVLKQILINLIKNAVEAMPGGGMVDIVSQGLIRRDGTVYSVLSVADNGPGIPPEVMASLFTPVQSTKGSGHSGLGLHIVHDLVNKMHGFISCRSDRQGTVFDILLPVASTSEAIAVIHS